MNNPAGTFSHDLCDFRIEISQQPADRTLNPVAQLFINSAREVAKRRWQRENARR
jgi:hypothetical protein